MKFLFSLLICLLAINANAQTTDSLFVKGSYRIVPILTDPFTNDSTTHFTFKVFDVSSDTSLPANSYIQFFDRRKKKVLEKNLTIPTAILRVWLDDMVIVDWICTNFGLTKLE